MNRKPIYHKQDSDYRVVSLPNGYWVAQRKVGGQGERDYDPWHNLHKPAPSQEQALQVMHERKPERRVA